MSNQYSKILFKKIADSSLWFWVNLHEKWKGELDFSGNCCVRFYMSKRNLFGGQICALNNNCAIPYLLYSYKWSNAH